jgi:hypothetical protein
MSIWSRLPTPCTRVGNCFTRSGPRRQSPSCAWVTRSCSRTGSGLDTSSTNSDVTAVDDHTVTVRLWRPVGRFGEGELRCPPLALRKLDRGTAIPHS